MLDFLAKKEWIIPRLFKCFLLLFGMQSTLLNANDYSAAIFKPPLSVNIPEQTFEQWTNTFTKKQAIIQRLLDDAHISQPNEHFLNGLVKEASPYLLRHAVNPINWTGWNDESLALAQKNQQLIFLSIGYSTCHWCHVMEKESFVDLTVAQLLNTSFIPIKVDREISADIDHYFMQVLEKVKGSAGWPITAILTPDGKPIWIESYVDKAKLLDVVERISHVWVKKPKALQQVANNLTAQLTLEKALEKTSEQTRDNQIWHEDVLSIKIASINQLLDKEFGGLKGSPKFPNAALLNFLIYQFQLSPSKLLKSNIETFLSSLMNSAINDHLHGGFHRYTTDDKWQIPHFEKMLYNQALLISSFSKAFKLFGNKEYKAVVYRTLSFLQEQMKNPTGGFFSAIDADYKGKEGRYYLFSQREKDEVEQSASKGVLWYRVSKNSEHYFLPSLNKVMSNEQNTNSQREALIKVKSLLALPHVDKKIITAWNALMVQAYIDAYHAFQDEALLLSALELATYIVNNHQFIQNNELVLFRSLYNDEYSGQGQLSDYAYLAKAVIGLYEITDDNKWLDFAKLYYQQGLALFSKNYSGETVSLVNRLYDGELLSAEVVLTQVGLHLIKMGQMDNKTTKNQMNLIKQAVNQSTIQSYSAISVIQSAVKGTFSNIQFFAKGHGKVLFKQRDDGDFLFSIQMDDGWHINSDEPLQKSLIPTLITSTNTDTYLKVLYPKSIKKSLGFSSQILELFEDEFQITGSTKMPTADTFKMSSTINTVNMKVHNNSLVLQLQACSDKICLLPEKLIFK